MFIFVVAACVYGSSSSLLLAMPRISSNSDRDYIVSMADLSKWSCGISFDNQERSVRYSRIFSAQSTYTVKTKKQLLYIGYDFKPWLVAYALGGSSQIDVRTLPKTDSEMEIGAGAQVNILNHDLLDPILTEDKITVNASLQLTTTEAKINNRTIEWRELNASITAAIVNDVTGNKLMLPESIALFAGPVYSDIIGSGIDEASGDRLGVTVGIEVYYTKRLAFNFRLDKFEEPAYSAGLRMNF